ncbi:MAG: hypothetical protein HC802_06810 [Caldilineaceae bacterium]|nr:hypothetical protein [Caldilineaceae bacterium]
MWLGILLGLATVSKLSALGLLALAGLVLAQIAWRHRSWRLLIQAAVWVGLPVLAIGGWWYLRNWQLYGDPLAWNIWQANILLRVAPADWRMIAGEVGSLERSFWGLFGWLNLPYPELVYSFFRALEFLIGFGLLLAGARWLLLDRRVDRRWWAGAILMIWLAILAISWLRFMRIAPAAQGRYFFPAAPTLAMLAALGIRAWRIPTLGALIVVCLLTASALTPFWLIRPAYEASPTHIELADVTPVEVNFGGQFALTGIATTPDQLSPGETVQVSLVWQALTPSERDLSVFVHLVDEKGLVIAQTDTMPGGGLRPTSQWRPGEVQAEQYFVDIPATAYTPNQGHWSVGLYEHWDGSRLPVVVESAGDELEAANGAVTFGNVILTAPAGAIPNAMQVEFADNVTLAGYAIDSRQLRPGDSVEVTLYWQARGPVGGDYTTFVHLLDGAFQTYGGHDGAPEPSTLDWNAGEFVVDRHRLRLRKMRRPVNINWSWGCTRGPILTGSAC